MIDWTVLRSVQDRSVNFIRHSEDGGNIEARYVRRYDDYFIVYLSSHTGWQTCLSILSSSTSQTYFEPVDIDLYLEQALRVITHYDAVADDEGPAHMVHYN